MNKEKLFRYYIRSGIISDEELYNLGLAKLDSTKPTIKNLPSLVITSDSNVVTTIEDTYVVYGMLGGTSEYIAFETKFNSMKEVANYIIENSRYETVDIIINANGNNGKTATSIQTVQFINDSIAPTISNLPTPVIISDSDIITTIQENYETYGEAGGTSEYIVFETKFSSMQEVVNYVIENSRYETVDIIINANANNGKITTSIQTVQFINDSTVPVISTLPSPIITNVTSVASSYVTYGESGGAEKYTVVGISETFTTMTALVKYADEWLTQNSQYEVEIEIKITAIGNNQKTSESAQTVKFIRGVNVTNETELNTALASTAPLYINVVNNIACSNTISVDGVTHTLDLNNSAISYSLSSTSSEATYTFLTLGSSTKLTVLDSSSSKQGSIIAKISETKKSDGTNREATIIGINNKGILNIESGRVGAEVSRIMTSAQKGIGVHDTGIGIQNSGTINLNGGTVSSSVTTQACTYLAVQISEANARGIVNSGTINATLGSIITSADAYMIRASGATVYGRVWAYAYGIENSGTINNSDNITFTTTATAHDGGTYDEQNKSANIK